MKVCIPAMGDKGMEDYVGEHFGRVHFYTLLDIETEKVEVLRNTSEHIDGQGYPPEILAKEEVDVMLCGAIGSRAIRMFEDLGIMVYVSAHGLIKDSIDMWKNNKFFAVTDKNACKQHAFRKHDHHHRNKDF